MTSQPTPTGATDRPHLTIERLHELVKAFLPDYLRFVEPGSVNFLDLQQLTVLETESPAFVAATVPAPLTQEIVTVLVLLQERPLSRQELSQAITDPLAQLDLRLLEPFLLSVIYLDGGRPGVNLETAALCRLFDQDLVRIYFTAWGGIKNLRAEYYVDRPEPLAWALAPYFRTNDPAALRARCRARIAAANGLDDERRALLLRAVDAAG
ncbi:MAG TPA: hypothetical protein VH988_13550 [Thermoanaerobaculia bacterium]|jgi:hypothetical protein|nr:hypothetical protein [Thermoanaerobaculia bacterium]